MKILIVDDIHYNLVLLERMLKGLGHNVIKASNAKDAIKSLETTKDISAVITDYAMPNENGMELKKKCHQKLRIEKGRELPHFIMLSAYITDELLNKAKRNGFCAVMSKPITSEQIKDCLEIINTKTSNKEMGPKKVLIYAPDQLIQEALQKCLPEEDLCIYWFSDLLQAFDCYKNQPDLSAVFCTQVCRGTSALDLIELCKDYKLFGDHGIIKQPSFHIVMNNTSASEAEINAFLDSAKALNVTEILYLPISTNKIRQAFNIPVLSENENIEHKRENKILIIEDTVVTRVMLEKLLLRSGYQVIASQTGYDALRYLREDPDINLVLCDLHLPDMQGDEILQQYEEMRLLSNDAKNKGAEFVLMTMARPETLSETVLQKNFAQIIHKPLNMLELDSIIYTLLKQK